MTSREIITGIIFWQKINKDYDELYDLVLDFDVVVTSA